MNTERPSDLSEEITSPPSEKFSADSLPSGPRILIAEDDAVCCEVLATRLKKWGYDTVVTRDGHEAMAVMRSANAPSLAILDWMMPGMDGIEVCRRLREINKAVYIIMLTSLGTKENILQALQAGADDYLVNHSIPSPFRIESTSDCGSLGYRARWPIA